MDGKELVRCALRGDATPRVPCGPLAVHYCAAFCGVDLESYTRQPAVAADCVVRFARAFRPDAVWVSADTWVTAEAMGAAVAFPGPGQPLCGTGEPLVRRAADIDRLPAPDPTARGRMPAMLEFLRTVVAELGADTWIVGCFDQSPFSLACALAGIDAIMVRLFDDPPFVHALVERCTEHAIAYGRAMAAAGADMLSTGDSPAVLIGPELYREFALPAERAVFAALQDTGKVRSLHICGDTTAVLADLATSGADVLELDHAVDLRQACATVPDTVALWGNLDPVAVLAHGGPAAVTAAATAAVTAVRDAGHRRFVLSSGCTLAVDTPADSLGALFAAARGTATDRP